MMYNKTVQDCFFHPRHVGVLDLANPYVVHFRREYSNKVIVIDLYMQCINNGLINKISYKTNGNPFIIAALEWLSRQLEGVELNNISLFNHQLLIKELEIPMIQYPVALQIEDVCKEVFALMKKKLEGYES